MTDQQWSNIFLAIDKDISDRRGLKWEWTRIDDDVKVEISKKWRQIVEEVEWTPERVEALVKIFYMASVLAVESSSMPKTTSRRSSKGEQIAAETYVCSGCVIERNLQVSRNQAPTLCAEGRQILAQRIDAVIEQAIKDVAQPREVSDAEVERLANEFYFASVSAIESGESISGMDYGIRAVLAALASPGEK